MFLGDAGMGINGRKRYHGNNDNHDYQWDHAECNGNGAANH
jgi:hypothetical protein